MLPQPGPATPLNDGRTAAPSQQPALGAAVRTTSLVTLASRLGGLIRDMLVVYLFGASTLGSAFQAAFQIPNLFRRLFGEGALSAAFIPEYTALTGKDPAQAGRLARYTLLRLAQITGVITVLVEGVLLALLLLLPADPDRQLSLRLIMVMFPFMPFICMAAIMAAMLQVHGRFGPSMSGPLLLNLFIVTVAGYCLLTGRTGPQAEWAAYAIGVATVLSGVTQALWFSRLLAPHVAWSGGVDGVTEPFRRMRTAFVPVMIGLGGLQIGAFLDTALAMYPVWSRSNTLLGLAYPMDDKSMAIITGCQRLYQFPLGVFGIAVATAAFPMLARATDRPALFLDTLRRGIRLSLFIGLPASAGLTLVAGDLVRVLFNFMGIHGFDADSLARATLALRLFAPAIWAYSLNHVVTRAFYARGDTATPMRVTLAMVAVSFVLAAGLMWFWNLREASIALASSIAAVTQALILLTLAQRRFCSPAERILDQPTRRTIERIATATVVMAAVVGLLLSGWTYLGGRGAAAQTQYFWELARLLVCVVAGLTVYVGEAAFSRSAELRWLVSRK